MMNSSGAGSARAAESESAKTWRTCASNARASQHSTKITVKLPKGSDVAPFYL